MADGITTQTATLATIPDATKISTDEDVANGHVQRMKLAVSADGSSTHVGADANGLQVQGAAAENAAAAGNPALVGGRYDATPRTLGDGDAGAIALDADGAVQISDGGNTVTVDGTVTETNSAAILADTANMDTNLGTLAGAVTGTEMQVDVVTSALPTGAATAANQLADGHNVTVDNAAGASAVNIQDGGNSITVDNAGLTELAAAINTNELDVNLASSNATVTVDLGANNDVTATGSVAHDAADSGNPVKVGLKAIAHGTNPTAVAAADRTDWYANRAGIPFMIGGHPNVVTVRANYTTAQTNAAVVTVGAGVKIVVTRLTVTVDNACSVDVQCRIGFATATTPTTTGVVLSHPGIAAGSGVVEGSGAGILGIGADNEDLRITSEVPTGGSIDVVVSYYTVPS